MSDINRRRLTLGLIAIAGIAALMSATAYPSSSQVYRVTPAGEQILDGGSYSILGYLFAASMVLAAVCAVIAFVFYRRNNRSAARTTLLIAAVCGIPAVVPAALSIAARLMVRKER